MKQLYTLCLGLLSLYSLSAQEDLSGIINSYAIVQDIDLCSNALTLDHVNGFEEGMNVIIYQAQGASIDLDNSSSFGTVTNLGQAGRYEKNQILSIAGSIVTLAFQVTQDFDPAGKVQLISFPSYEKAVVSDTLKGKPWDGAQGGIIALQVTDTLDLQAPIYANGIGFRGGLSIITASNNCSFVTSANNYSYDSNNWRGAPKGEGIAIITPGAENGRGPQANGGGGGNDHNAGGGGGSNLTKAGQGGTNEEPTFFGCDGNFPGFGGREIESDSTRLFLGGGGGAGHENNDVGTDGGNGGGIIILLVNHLIDNGFPIQADGQGVQQGGGDGAGGGGAGGTILLLYSTPTPLVAQALGGDGGSLDHGNADRCHGPGGGGSGGHILTNGLNIDVALQTTGGAAGIGFNSGACVDGNNGSEPGSLGQITAITTIAAGDQAFAEAAILTEATNLSLCEGENGFFGILSQGVQLEFQWQINRGNGFENLSNGLDFQGVNSDSLEVLAATSLQDDWLFQVLITNECGASLSSQNATLTVSPKPTASFTSNQNGSTFNFTNTSVNAATYSWDFGDGQLSSEISPSHTYDQSGDFEVVLTAFSDCDTVQTSVQVSIEGAPIASFTSDPSEGCTPLSVSFTNTSSGDVNSIAWLFPGGSPAFSTESAPVISYANPGSYDVTLIVSNAAGVDSIRLADHIQLSQAPTADFDFSVDGLVVSFSDASTSADNIEWYIPALDTASTNSNFSINFPEAGTYDVQLTASNACGSVTTEESLTIGQAPNANFSFIPTGACEEAAIIFSDQSTGAVETYKWEFPGGTPATSTEANPIIFYENAGLYTVSLLVNGSLGQSEIVKEGAVEVLLRPSPNFDFIIDGLSVSFQNTSSDADRYTWSFGDGNTSSDITPTHVYTEPGLYDVSLNAQNRYCGLAISKAVFLKPNSTSSTSIDRDFLVFPNPFDHMLNFEYEGTIRPDGIRYEIFDDLGRLLERGSFDRIISLTRPQWTSGTYWIKFKVDNQTVWKKISKAQ